MYICLCRGITDRHVHAAQENGADTAKGVFESHGASPKCGKCVRHIQDRLTGLVPPARAIGSATA